MCGIVDSEAEDGPLKCSLSQLCVHCDGRAKGAPNCRQRRSHSDQPVCKSQPGARKRKRRKKATREQGWSTPRGRRHKMGPRWGLDGAMETAKISRSHWQRETVTLLGIASSRQRAVAGMSNDPFVTVCVGLRNRSGFSAEEFWKIISLRRNTLETPNMTLC